MAEFLEFAASAGDDADGSANGDGFGEIFRMLSFQQIGSAAIMSRAIAGVRKGKLIIALPGSPDACKLAMDQLIIPEIGHIVSLLRK